ncbi:hypothetical protein SPRG_01162 [Saprolegnia parasitica CBS 223.65]|uniref:Uncharacterized protein n=1 Tax=Saprolegnia parasitica (strain CBS 223.65) TaxID=695850 RepID=A0A067D7W5_SAPPC|nr:hypothetical protein SPRG_01162 [Saprolegnia parasitica CBS 223.65]KDO35097.1 hypothetical protein SPRG_01162 [Saprolegnia parasitica CBS 223.65]|eukprot:XP_012194747.1 hypothetical protein SPRG_01162 [Saprolegnia parasitica CBS 223.65]
MVLSWLSLSLVAPYMKNDCLLPNYYASNASHLLTHSFDMELAFASQTASGWTTGPRRRARFARTGLATTHQGFRDLQLTRKSIVASALLAGEALHLVRTVLQSYYYHKITAAANGLHC